MSQQEKIIKYFIKNSPIGELQQIIQDLKVLAGGEEILHRQPVRDALRQYYESHRQQIKLDDDRIVMVNEMWRQEPIKIDDGQEEEQENAKTNEFVYFDPKHNVKFSFCPLTLKAETHGDTNDFPEQIDPDWGSYKDGVQELIEQYVDQHYKKDASRASLCFNQAGHLQIDISCINLKLSQFWTGEWQSKWSIDIQNQKLYGIIKINNHYWETGNIQFNLLRKYDEVDLESADAAVIVAMINKQEAEYQAVVEDTLDNSREEIFKKMRRIKPIAGGNFNWIGQKAVMS